MGAFHDIRWESPPILIFCICRITHIDHSSPVLDSVADGIPMTSRVNTRCHSDSYSLVRARIQSRIAHSVPYIQSWMRARAFSSDDVACRHATSLRFLVRTHARTRMRTLACANARAHSVPYPIQSCLRFSPGWISDDVACMTSRVDTRRQLHYLWGGLHQGYF